MQNKMHRSIITGWMRKKWNLYGVIIGTDAADVSDVNVLLSLGD